VIKRFVILAEAITKEIGESKTIMILASHLKTQNIITMQEMRLPEFDKRQINQQKVLVFDNYNVKYNVILGTIFIRQELNGTNQKDPWNGLIDQLPFIHQVV
jgi:hypothetical protein